MKSLLHFATSDQHVCSLAIIRMPEEDTVGVIRTVERSEQQNDASIIVAVVSKASLLKFLNKSPQGRCAGVAT